MENTGRVLIVDDEKIALKNLEHIMKKEGYEVTVTQSGSNALKILESGDFDIVLTDLRMDKVDGIQILRKTKDRLPDSEVIMITGYATIETAIEAMKQGAYYYLAKPYKLEEVRKVVSEALEKVRLKKENLGLREQLEKFEGRIKIITQNLQMKKILDTAVQIGPTDCNVLISGESGTGKEILARYIHACSSRAGGPMVAINCGAFNEELLTNELFGHEKGAFTGADRTKPGHIEMADRGTLFLDEITEMTPGMQVKLLRVIQERQVLRLGSTVPFNVDVRFIAATNRDIQDALASGRFRQDLYFRLNVVSFHLPPLADRRDDISLLCYFFLKKYNAVMKKDVRELSPEVMSLLMNYDFPGNVRELENIIERGVALSNGAVLEVVHLPEDLRELSIRTFRKKEGRIPTLEEQEKSYIQWVLRETGGNKTLSAQILGIDRVSLWRKLKQYGFEGD